jgi:hypothetical protein
MGFGAGALRPMDASAMAATATVLDRFIGPLLVQYLAKRP